MKKKSKGGRPLKFKEKTTTMAFRLPVSRVDEMRTIIDKNLLRFEKQSKN